MRQRVEIGFVEGGGLFLYPDMGDEWLPHRDGVTVRRKDPKSQTLYPWHRIKYVHEEEVEK